MAETVERLTVEFGQLPFTTVVRVITDCAEEYPEGAHFFFLEAARARLRSLDDDAGGALSQS